MFFIAAPIIHEFMCPKTKKLRKAELNTSLHSERDEFSRIQSFLSRSGREILVRFGVIGSSILSEVLQARPRVLHVNCHAYPSPSSGEVVLALEREHGLLYEFSKDMLRRALSASGNMPDLVFVSSCHSLQVGKVFRDAGAPFVVAVHSETKVLDAACMAFSEMVTTLFPPCFGLMSASY